MSDLKILIVCSTLNLKHKLGCTPAWWQLLKALHETGNEVVVIPYLGDPIESLWWRTYKNPCSRESIIFESHLTRRKEKGKSPSGRELLSPIFERIIRYHIRPKWEKHLWDVLKMENGVDALLFMNIPMNHMTGIPSKIKKEFGIPVAYYDGDMPTILPKYATDRGFRFDYYAGADPSEYDAFFTNSKGVIPDLIEMGARNVHPLYWAADPALFTPINLEQNIDVSFFGYGSELREHWMDTMITVPSRRMPNVDFTVAGGGFSIHLGKARLIGDLSYSAFREFCCRSKINLNITRWSHTAIYASATSRPFELAAFGACIVSQPYNGIQEWFELDKEILVLDEDEDVCEVFEQLLDDDERRLEMGRMARERLLKEHTFHHRAQELVHHLSRCS